VDLAICTIHAEAADLSVVQGKQDKAVDYIEVASMPRIL
jgi:hypothetical protein